MGKNPKEKTPMPQTAIVPSAAMVRAKKMQAAAPIPDDNRWKCKFEVRSETTNQIYRCSFDSAPGAGYWVCSCRGCLLHGSCKHLEASGLRGRKFGKDLDTLKALGLA